MALRARLPRRPWLRFLVGLVLVAGAAGNLIPVLLLLTASLKPAGQEFAFPPAIIPTTFQWENFTKALAAAPFLRYLLNTLTIFVGAVSGALVTAPLAAYAFARIRFPGRDALFLVVISTVMLPDAVTLIPRFIEFRYVGWINTFMPLIIPTWLGGGAFNIFLLRQFFMSIPYELDEAARIDGANHLQILWRVLLPLSAPAVATIVMFSFVTHWNEFLAPLIYLTDAKKYTLALGLYSFVGQYATQWNLLLAASFLMLLPMLVVFFAAQRYFIEGLQFSGLGGK